jgi:hypothetical protein
MEGNMKAKVLKKVIQLALWCFGFERIIYNVPFIGSVKIQGGSEHAMVVINCSFDGGAIIAV